VIATIFDHSQLQCATFSHARFPHASFRGVNGSLTSLPWSVLGHSDWTGAILDGADLTGAILDGAQMGGASMRGATMDGVSLVGADLTGAVLDGASLADSDLTSALVTGASFVGTDMSECVVGRHLASEFAGAVGTHSMQSISSDVPQPA